VFTFIEANKNNEIYKKNNIDYLLIIGDDTYEFFNEKNINKYVSEKYDKNKYIEKNKLNDYIVNEGFYFVWKIIFNSIYININKEVINMEQIKNIFLDNDYGLISGTGEYRNLIEKHFFNEYINKSKCAIDILKTKDLGNFYYYECDSDININNFPNLYFKSKNFQYEFQLTKDDLFAKDNDKIYFLIVFEFSRTNTWKLGKPFLEKYLFSYNYDAKTVIFYNDNLPKDESNTNNNNTIKKYLIIIVIIIVSLIALVVGFLLGRYIYNQRKNRIALELKSSFDYEYSNEKLNSNEQNIN
jgi:hypothetical protein